MARPRSKQGLVRTTVKRRVIRGGLQGMVGRIDPGNVLVELPQVPHPNGKGLTFAEVGFINEFGSPEKNIPERPAWRTALNLHRHVIRKFEMGLYKKLLWGDLKKAAFLEKIGRFMVQIVRTSILEWNTPPNAESTIKKKGSNNPLIDTKATMAAVTWTSKKRGT